MTTMALNVQELSPVYEQATPELPADASSCSCGLALAGYGEAYNEDAFHHFLSIERKRSEASARPFLLLMVELERQSGVATEVDPRVAAPLFAGLAECLRDTDVIGWYRDNRIAGAVLTDLGEAPQLIVPTAIAERVTDALRAGLPADVAPRVQVRTYQLPARVDRAATESRRQRS